MATFGTFVSGQILTAAELNDAGTWDDYTPTFTQSATITKTVNWARYMQFNKLIVVNLKMTASSAGTANNVIKIGLPVNASANNYLMGSAISSRTALTPRFAIYDTTSTVKFTVALGNPDADFHGESAGDGFTVASGDIYYVNLCYEAA